ncbi:MAG: L-serine ammonia-lyase, iron-sulfur-dependent subunit beta [Clostridiales bacterium]|nr:L-serine ammonia-lyase, iron-sulfur-dependent subunit beta [Clostridiales bacterium]
MNIFDILGPVMVGPSSSHTAGAVRIGYITRSLLHGRPVKASIGLHGSFAATGKGHGTDRALAAGLLGMRPDDMRIPDSLVLARQEGLELDFHDIQISGAHPNTALLNIVSEDGKAIEVQASSVGGGRIMVNKLDGIIVNFSGEAHTLIVYNTDTPGYVAQVTGMLAGASVNIANMNLYRGKRGGCAVMVMEIDQPVPPEALRWLEGREGITKVIYIEGEA